MDTIRPRKPEIMSPAGHWPQLHAAIEAGADSVYFGLKHFSARAKVGFSLYELPEAIRTLHRRGVKGFVTFNTLVFDHELAEAARTIAAIAEAGADALIVQDVGVLKLVREIAPGLEIHGSTQMSITSAEGVELARALGVHRVTLARELALSEVRAIASQTNCELEIFVHGALCVAYSGQCFSSEAWGGRSANRGQCAQACRLPYDLIVDGRQEPLGDSRYLLSPGDLYALHHVPEMVDIGIAALKIEGRYKDAEYVALTTRAYRHAVDAAWEGSSRLISAAEELALEQVYSRGLGAFFIAGTDHQAVVKGRAPRHRGVLMGRVLKVMADGLVVVPATVHSLSPLKPGDGIVLDAADWRSPEEHEEGGRIFSVKESQGNVELRFGNRAVDFTRIRPGDLVWRTHDPDLDRMVRPLVTATAPVRKQMIDVDVVAREGEALVSTWRLRERPAVTVTVQSEALLERADRRALDVVLLQDQFGRLGNTPYSLGELRLDCKGNPFAPASLLNAVRRDAVEHLQRLQASSTRQWARDPLQVVEESLHAIHIEDAEPVQPQLHVLVRTPEQLDAALQLNAASITLDYLDLYGLRPSVERVKADGIQVRVASPRVLKPSEERIVHFLRKLDCAILVRSAGLLHSLRQLPHPQLTGDFSLNAANAIAGDEFLRMGLERITPTHDLNADQVTTLARELGASRIEAIAYQHLPVFHMEHCVFCRFLSTGTSYKDCGRPCESHRVAVRDQSGRMHPVMADVGCRNTVFGAEAQEASAHLNRWLEAGIRHLRLEFAQETGEQLIRVFRAFDAAVNGRSPIEKLPEIVRRSSPFGTTEGSLYVPSGYRSLPILQ